MDSLSQLALGSAVGVAVMGRRTSLWKAALWGGVCGTLPDLDVFIDHGDALRNMTLHRAESHSLVYLTLLAPAIAVGVAKLHGEMAQYRRWWLAIWLALITHPLLDWMTIYGTQLWLPFTDRPYGVGSVFIIDPLYTLPLIVGLVGAAVARAAAKLRWNSAGLIVSTLYLAWSVVAQANVNQLARAELLAAGLPSDRVVVTPTPFNTVLWRVLAMTPEGHAEGFYSLLDSERRIRFARYPHDRKLAEQLSANSGVRRLSRFSYGFVRVTERDNRAIVADLRMGQEPNYVFSFVVGERMSPQFREITPVAVGSRGDSGAGLAWVWRRLQGDRSPVKSRSAPVLP